MSKKLTKQDAEQMQSIMERMENEGIVGPANHAGKREILVETQGHGDDE